MRLLIVNLHLDIGGVETLLVRLIPFLSKGGIEITLLILQENINQEFLASISPFCKVVKIKDSFPFTKKRIKAVIGDNFDVAYFTISQAFVIGSWLLGKVGSYKTKLMLGAYQTEIFCPKAKFWHYHRNLVQNFIRSDIPARNIIFGNTAGRDFHATRLGVSLDEAPIIRLFVDIEKYNFLNKSTLKRRKIVSIGRVTKFKTYNFTMVPVISELIREGYDLEWHIYGDGEQLQQLKEAVHQYNIESNVLVHGALEYSKFQTVLEDAFLFVGSGTSLIEAAACGVPALTTIEYSNEPHTYGYINEIEGFNLVEPNLNNEVSLIKNRIITLLKMTEDQYSKLQASCYTKACLYSGEAIVDTYISAFQSSLAIDKRAYVGTHQLFVYSFSAFLNYFMTRACRFTKKIG